MEKNEQFPLESVLKIGVRDPKGLLGLVFSLDLAGFPARIAVCWVEKPLGSEFRNTLLEPFVSSPAFACSLTPFRQGQVRCKCRV